MRQLLGAVMMLIIGVPLFQNTFFAEKVQVSLFVLVYLLAVLAIGAERHRLIQGLIFLVPAIVCKLASEIDPTIFPPTAAHALAFLLLAYVVANLLIYVVRSPKVDIEVLCAAIAGYLLLSVVFAFAYLILSEIVPDAFSLPASANSTVLDIGGSIYFSFITIATVGFGDIVPRIPIARTLTAMEAVSGTFYMAVLIARLVAQYTSERTLVSEK
jgi:voltage-gated potassium channel